MTKNDGGIILITGATGTVGSEVVKQLLASSSSSDHNLIRAAVHSQNKSDNFKQYDNNAVETVNMDYNKPETIADALNKVDKLFLLTLPAPNIVTDTFSSVVKEALISLFIAIFYYLISVNKDEVTVIDYAISFVSNHLEILK